MARWRKLGVVAGGGALPKRIADGRLARGEAVHVVRLAGWADDAMMVYPGETIGVAEVGKVVRSLRNAGCDALVMAGTVGRPDFKTLLPDWRGAALLTKVISAASKGDGAILSVMVEMFESEGFLVVGAEEALSELAMPEGALGRVEPSVQDVADFAKAASIVRALGPFDVGQAAVVASGRVLAIEAAEGTDAMLERCAALRRNSGEHEGVLVKRPKPGQELRVDLPTVGVETITRAHAAGLKGVAAEAGVALLIDAAEAVKEADRLRMFLYGFTAAEIA
jgi:DUF1009 family protein